MLVRDRTLTPKEYKGKWTEALDSSCPCRPCFSAHDCGRYNSMGRWIPNMQCATRHNSGCPNPRPPVEHVFAKRGWACKRCGAHR